VGRRSNLSSLAESRQKLVCCARSCWEHGAYYTGKIGAVSAIARWHAKKQRFVFGQFNFGRHRVTSIPHVVEQGPGETVRAVIQSGPTDTSRVSDYAFETAA
jgi:hypothetical protein